MNGRSKIADGSYTAVVMAGRRSGAVDPVAAHAGTTHKCLVPVAGRAMLLRVLEALEMSPSVGRIVLCVDTEFAAPDFVSSRIAANRLQRIDSGESPAASAAQACALLESNFPLLIVTADHALLSPAIVEHFCESANVPADVVVGVASAKTVLSRYAGATRTLLRFADGPYCGCNLFAFNRSSARVVADYWRQMETARKRPWRLLMMLGARPLIEYFLNRLHLADALNYVATKLDITAAAVELPFAEAAIDVDKLADLELVEQILTAAPPS